MKKLIRPWNSILPEPGQHSAQLSKLIRLTACKKANHAIHRWYRTLNTSWLIVSYDTQNRKSLLNSNRQALHRLNQQEEREFSSVITNVVEQRIWLFTIIMHGTFTLTCQILLRIEVRSRNSFTIAFIVLSVPGILAISVLDTMVNVTLLPYLFYQLSFSCENYKMCCTTELI